MTDYLVKAHDIVIENQRNADNKAYLFILLISAFLTFVWQIPLDSFTSLEQKIISIFIFVIVVPLMLFIISLIPIYGFRYKLHRKVKGNLILNIFYWKSMANFNNESEFISAVQDKYDIKNMNVPEKDLLSQLYTNSMILERKTRLHKAAFIILYQFVLIAFDFLIYHYIFGVANYWIFAVIFVISETLFFLFFTGLLKYIKMKKRSKTPKEAN